MAWAWASLPPKATGLPALVLALNVRLKALEHWVGQRWFGWLDGQRFGLDPRAAVDNTLALDAAFRALAAQGGGHLTLPPGHFTYTGDVLTLTTSGVTISGCGMGATTLDFPTNGAAANRRLYVNGAANVVIRDLTITSSDAASRTGVYGLVHADTSAANVHLRRVEITNSPGTGVMFMRGVTRSSVSRCYVHGNWADGIHYQRGVSDSEISHNVCRNNGDDDIALISHGFTETANGGPWGYVRDIRVLGNRVGDQNPTLALGSGIYLGGAVGCVVSGNIVRNTQAFGIAAASYNGGAEGHAMTGQHVISGNTVQGTGLNGGGAREGIKIVNARAVRVTGNRIEDAGSNGLTLAGALIDVQASGNTITNSPSRGVLVEPTEVSTAEALLLWTDARWSTGESLAYVFGHRVAVTDNAIDGTGIEGIYIAGSASRQIAGVTCARNTISNYNTTNSASNGRGVSVSYVDNYTDDDSNTVLGPYAGSSGTSFFYSNTARALVRQALGADGSVIGTVAATVPSLSVTLAAGRRYAVRGQVLFTVGLGTDTIALRGTYSGTLGSTAAGRSILTFTGINGVPTSWKAPTQLTLPVNAAMPATTSGPGAMTGGEVGAVLLDGTVYTSTGGTLAIEVVSTSASGFVPKAGCWIEVIEIKS